MPSLNTESLINLPQNEADKFVAWVRAAAPYIHAFSGRTFVIAFGGELLANSQQAQSLAYDCNLLAALGIRLVLVHGARAQIDAEMARRGLASHFHNNVRITDAAALECVKAATGTVRIELEALLSQGLPNTPMAGAHMRVTGGNFITARPLGVIDGVDHQYTGTVRKIIAEEIRADLEQENVVLISTLAASPAGELFNLALEEVAGAVAVAVRAEKLIFLCDAPGLLDAQGTLIHSLTASEAETRLREAPPPADSIARCLPHAIDAVRKGVSRAHLIDQNADGALLLEFFTRAGVGTMLSREPLFCLRQASAEDIGALIALIAPMEADGTLVRRNRDLLEQEIDRFTLIEHDGVLIGCAALYPFSDDNAAELACLAVTPEHRRAGLGEQLLARLEAQARERGFQHLFVLTTRTAHWFLERGFTPSSPERLPQQKRELYNYQRRSKVFVKTLDADSAA